MRQDDRHELNIRVAISTRRIVDPDYGEVRDALSRDWGEYLLGTWPNLTLVPVLNHPENIENWADALDIQAMILSNGNDWGSAPERDQTETRLVNWCRRKARPVLGICRGLQALNAMLGGQLETNVAQLAGQSHGGKPHKLSLVDPYFSQLAGEDSISVNSYHNQGVALSGLADGLKPFAVADGEIVEGFYHASEAILAIQWHPERPGAPTDFDTQLIQQFLKTGGFWMQHGQEKTCKP